MVGPTAPSPDPEPSTPDPPWLSWLGRGLVVVLLAAWLVPALPGLGSRFLGVEYVDHYGTLWFYWFAGEVLRGAQDLRHSDLFFFPWGKDIFGHTGSNIVDAVAAWPLRAVLGAVLGYNGFIVLLVASNLWAGVRLARLFTESVLGRWTVAGLIAFQPFLLNEIVEGRPTQAMLIFVLLFFERLLRLPGERGWKGAVLAGLLLAMTGYVYWFNAIFAGLGALVMGLWMVARAARAERLGLLGRLALAASVAVALCLPAAWPLIAASSGGQVPGLLDVSVWSMDFVAPLTREGQLVALYTWQPLGGGQGFWMMGLDADEHFIPRLDPIPPVLLLCLAVVLLRPGRLPRGGIAAVAVLATAIGLGPILVLGSVIVTNPIYGPLLQLIPPLQRLWWPGRAFVLIGVLVPLGAAALLDALQTRRSRALVAAALLGGLGLSLWRGGLLPVPSWDATIPAGYRCLATGPEGAIIELPYAFTQGHLYYQTAHGRPIFGGMLENNPIFAPDESVALQENNTFLRALLDGPPQEGQTVIDQADRQELYDLGYRYVVLQVDAFRAREALKGMAGVVMDLRLHSQRRAFERLLGLAVYEDARVVIWAPWGDPAPCDPKTFARDEKSPGRTDVVSQSRDRGRGAMLSHVGRKDDATLVLARLLVERGGPMADVARQHLADLEAAGAPAEGEGGAAPPEE